MPIIPTKPVSRISEEAFHELDFQIMKLAFGLHNRLGRFYDENIYQHALLEECRIAGLQAEAEFEVKLTHRDFSKSFFIDLLIEGSTVYELKTAKAIHEANRIQALDYLFLTDTRHGKLVNFRPPSVEHEFVSTSLSYQERRSITAKTQHWTEPTDTAPRIKTLLIDLLDDWGAFLNTAIYQEALCFFLGGENALIRPIEIWNRTHLVGHQRIPVINDTETFCLTSATKDIPSLKTHLSRFLSNTRLETLYWINFNRFTIEFYTLENKSFCP